MNITKMEKCLLLQVLFLGLLFVGTNLNLSAVLQNSCKMPVYYEGDFKAVNDIKHFGYNNISQINGTHLTTDILETKKYIFSWGDIIILLSLIGEGVTTVLFYFLVWKRRNVQIGAYRI